MELRCDFSPDERRKWTGKDEKGEQHFQGWIEFGDCKIIQRFILNLSWFWGDGGKLFNEFFPRCEGFEEMWGEF